MFDKFVTGVYGINEVERAFADSRETIKAIVSFERC